MAYAFDKVQDLLNPNKGFALAEDSNQQSQAPGLSSSTSGDIAPPSGSEASSTTYQAQPSTAAAARGVLSKNKGQAQSPINIAGLKQGIGSATTNLKNEADKYTASAADPYKNWMTDLGGANQALTAGVSQYVQGGASVPIFEPYPGLPATGYDSNAQTKEAPKDWLDLLNSAPATPGAFKPTTSTDFRGVSDLQSGAGGIRKAFQSSGGARYTPGMASMDTSLLLQDPNFATAAEDITKSVGGLKKYESELLDNAPKAAQNVASNFQSALKDAVKVPLWSEQSNLTQQQKDEASSPTAFTDYTTQSDVLRKQLSADNPQWAEYLKTLGEDEFKDLIRKSTKPGERGSANWEDYIDEDEAGRFNRIEGLLGSGKTYVKGNKGGKDSELDLEGLKVRIGLGASGFVPPVVDYLPGSRGKSAKSSTPDDSGLNGRVGQPEQQPGSPNEITVDVPGVGPVTITLPYQPPKDPEGLAKDALMPIVPMNKALTKDLSIPESSLQGKIIKGAGDLVGGSPGDYVAMSSPSPVLFPSVQGMLGSGRSSTYEGKVDPNMIAGSYIDPFADAPAPTLPQFSGFAGGENLQADKPKLSPEASKKAEKELTRLLRRFR